MFKLDSTIPVQRAYWCFDTFKTYWDIIITGRLNKLSIPEIQHLSYDTNIEDFADKVWISVLYWSSPNTWNIAYMSGNEV